MSEDRSTLLTSPLSMSDFVVRTLFFAAAPFAIVGAAELFPVRGVLIDVALGLFVFTAGEAVSRRASSSRILKALLEGALTFETYYRERPPRRFAYYVFYPLLFPYWLLNRDARREFVMFRGYTLGGLAILIASLGWQYVEYWRPELGFKAFLPAVAMTLGVETLLVLMLLMPIATTIVSYHASFRRRRLAAMLLVGLVSTGAAVWRISSRRDPIASYSARDRVRLRTRAEPRTAHHALMAAARAAWNSLVHMRGLDGDGKVEGEPLDLARERLVTFYKSDEANAFDLWGSPRRHPRILVLYFEARRKKPAIWVAIDGYGEEIKKISALPGGANQAMRRASDGTDPVIPWPSDVLPASLPGVPRSAHR